MLGTATKLQNARNIKISGDLEGEENFDGSEDVEINVKHVVKKKTITNNETLQAQITLEFKRCGNVVTCRVDGVVPENAGETFSSASFSDQIPQWARPNKITAFQFEVYGNLAEPTTQLIFGMNIREDGYFAGVYHAKDSNTTGEDTITFNKTITYILDNEE